MNLWNWAVIYKKMRSRYYIVSMPYTKEFVLIKKRMMPRSIFKSHIMVSIWGEFSPVIASSYDLEFFGDENVNTKYILKEAKENFYLYEKSEEFEPNDRIKKSNSMLLKSFERRLTTFPVFKQLY